MVVRNIKYTPIITKIPKVYSIDLSTDSVPFWFKTMTTDMAVYTGIIEHADNKHARIKIHDNGFEISGRVAGTVYPGSDGYAIEHLTVEGNLEYLISDTNFLNGNQNFVNFGTMDNYIRIDIYTGESKVING